MDMVLVLDASPSTLGGGHSLWQLVAQEVYLRGDLRP